MFKSKEELEVERIYRRVEDLLKKVTASESAAEESIEKKYFNIWKGEKTPGWRRTSTPNPVLVNTTIKQLDM